MAKSYNFIISLQKAIFEGIHVSIIYGGRETNYGDFPFTGTLADVIAKRQVLSDAETRPHAASVRMAYRSDRKAPGINNVKFLYASKELATSYRE
jgi:hypothetical protein